MTQPDRERVSYGTLARLFLRLSVTAFGGPVAHIAMAEDEIVTRRHWLTREHFLDLIAATNLIPGPNSTEVMIHVGYTLRGIPGAILSGLCFILPTFFLTLALAVLYVSSGTIPAVEALLWGIKPVIIAIIANAGYRLAPSALKSLLLWLTFIGAIAAILLGVPEVIAMLGAGLIFAVIETRDRLPLISSGLLLFQPSVLAAGARASAFDVFFYFLKIGSVLFGSGYVLIAYIQQDLVSTFKWLSSRELLDAVAIGQVTPGPVSTTATVVGYIVAGFPGAFAATFGIFLPSFIFVILTAPLIPKMRRSPFMSAFLDGVNAGVIAAILITVVGLAGEALQPYNGVNLTSGVAVVLGVAAFVALIRFRVNATWLILAGALVGLFVQLLVRG
ncbi:MAG TPA: chromate efflux transporter [Phototrophicaceae bacterium]|nr:chromate efflux transporter [Phototrophicaceae bacterium]